MNKIDVKQAIKECGALKAKHEYAVYFVMDPINRLSDEVPGNDILEMAFKAIQHFRLVLRPRGVSYDDFYVNIGQEGQMLVLVAVKDSKADLNAQGLMADWEGNYYGCGLEFEELKHGVFAGDIEEAVKTAMNEINTKIEGLKNCFANVVDATINKSEDKK